MKWSARRQAKTWHKYACTPLFHKTDFHISMQGIFRAPRFAQIQHSEGCLNSPVAVMQTIADGVHDCEM
jgi:hypothetical protein